MTTLDRRLERTERLSRAVGRLRRAMLARVGPVLEHEGHPLVHWQLVSAIAYDGLHSQAALATRVGIDPAGTSRALDELDDLGLVKRQRDPVDRRRVTLNLTAKGVRWYERVRPRVMGAIAPLFEPLKREEAVQLEALLSRLATHSSASGSISDGSA